MPGYSKKFNQFLYKSRGKVMLRTAFNCGTLFEEEVSHSNVKNKLVHKHIVIVGVVAL